MDVESFIDPLGAVEIFMYSINERNIIPYVRRNAYDMIIYAESSAFDILTVLRMANYIKVLIQFLMKGGITMNISKRKVLTIKEAAKLIEGLTEYRIRQMCLSGQLPCFMAGKKYLISEEALMKAVFGHYEPEDGDTA